MRSEAAAGRFYPGSRGDLKSELDYCFKRGPGRKRPKNGRSPLGIISPHAGYSYSGPTAAHGFLSMADGGMPETIIFVGPNHTGMGKHLGMSDEDWKTPLGVMKLDSEIFQELDVPIDRSSHAMEHSIEVQLPFVQYFNLDIEQVCISMMDQSLGTSVELGSMIAGVVKGSRKKIGLVASSDFTHCGSAYGYPIPRTETPGGFARSRDEPVIEKLVNFDLQGAFEKRDELGTTACGLGPIAAVLKACSLLGAGEVVVNDYTTSYDISPSDLAVGYASMSVY